MHSTRWMMGVGMALWGSAIAAQNAPRGGIDEPQESRERAQWLHDTGPEGLAALQQQRDRFDRTSRQVDAQCHGEVPCMSAFFRAYAAHPPMDRPGATTVWGTPVHLRWVVEGKFWVLSYEGLERGQCQLLVAQLTPIQRAGSTNASCHEGTGVLEVPMGGATASGRPSNKG